MLRKNVNTLMQYLNISYRLFMIIGTRLSIEFIILSLKSLGKFILLKLSKGFKIRNVNDVKYFIKFSFKYKPGRIN